MNKIVLVLSVAVFAVAYALPADVSKSVQATSININGKEATQVVVDGKEVHRSVDSRFAEEGGSLDSRFGFYPSHGGGFGGSSAQASASSQSFNTGGFGHGGYGGGHGYGGHGYPGYGASGSSSSASASSNSFGFGRR